MIHVEPHPEGAVLLVRAHPAARRNEIAGEHGGALRVAVPQAPEKGKANQAIAELLAERLGLRRRQVELVSGAAAPQKRFLIRGLSAAELIDRLARVIARDARRNDAAK